MESRFSCIRGTEKQKQARDLLTYAAWGKNLSLEQYLIRETRLRENIWSQQNQTTWILEDSSLGPLASCETFDMKSSHGKAIGIASVFTEPSLRGRGYSSSLLRKLIQNFSRLSRSLSAIVLYSEVGFSLYQKLGFVPVASEEWVFTSRRMPENARLAQLLSLREIHPRFLPPPPDGKFLIWPDFNQLSWHWERQTIYAEFLNQSPCLNLKIGARIGSSFILWMADYKEKTLRVLCLVSKTLEDSMVLMQTALDYSALLGFLSVRVWVSETDPYWNLLPEFKGFVQRIQREDSLSMILPIDPRLQPQDWSCISRAIWV